jgi:hypothetical protein
MDMGHGIWNKEELPHQWKESIIVLPIQKIVTNLTVVIIKHVIAVNFIQSCIQHSSL